MTTPIERIREAQQRQEINELNHLMDEVEAELSSPVTGGTPDPELTEEEKRYLLKREAHEIANNLSIPSALSGIARKGTAPAPLGPDASATEIASRLHI